MRDEPISVIIPVFNGEKYLSEALASVFQQDVRPMEVIVVNDGSTDDTAKVMDGFLDQIRMIHQENLGPAAARNAGLDIASGEMIAFLDADDLWSADHLRLLLECLCKFPDIGAGLGRIQHINAESTCDQLSFIDEPFSTLHLSCALFRRSVFDRVGHLDETMRFSEDIDWFMRAREKGIKMMLRQEVVLYYRRHEANITNVNDFKELDLIKALKKSIDRRKKEHQAADSLSSLLIFEELP